VVALSADLALLGVIASVLSTLKLMVPRIGTLGTILLPSRIIILSAVLTLLHEAVQLPHVPGVGPAGPPRGGGPAGPAHGGEVLCTFFSPGG